MSDSTNYRMFHGAFADHQIRDEPMDKHHLLYTRHGWYKGETKKLRLHPYCIVSVPRDTLHGLIHRGVPEVPPPTELAARDAIEQLEMLKRYNAIGSLDDIEKRLMVLFALFECESPATADAIAEQLVIVRDFYSKLP